MCCYGMFINRQYSIMFTETSRYTNIETAELTTPEGRVIRYVRRRFLPDGDAMPLLMEVTVTEGDRLDLIATNASGEPAQYWHICDANNAMNPADLVAEPGRQLRIALPQFHEQREA